MNWQAACLWRLVWVRTWKVEGAPWRAQRHILCCPALWDAFSEVYEFDSGWYWQWSLLIVVVYCKLCVYKRLIDCFNWRCRVDVKTRGTWWRFHPRCYTGRKRWNEKGGGKIRREVWVNLNACVNTAEINCVLIIELQAVSEIFNLSKLSRRICVIVSGNIRVRISSQATRYCEESLIKTRQFYQQHIGLLITSLLLQPNVHYIFLHLFWQICLIQGYS